MASSSSAAMKTSLVFMLLLGAVVAAHAGRPVSCKNECPHSIWLAGVEVEAHAAVTLVVPEVVEISFYDATGVKLGGSFACPKDVNALVVLYEQGCLKVEVGAVGLISGLVQTLVGHLLYSIECLF